MAQPNIDNLLVYNGTPLESNCFPPGYGTNVSPADGIPQSEIHKCYAWCLPEDVEKLKGCSPEEWTKKFNEAMDEQRKCLVGGLRSLEVIDDPSKFDTRFLVPRETVRFHLDQIPELEHIAGCEANDTTNTPDCLACQRLHNPDSEVDIETAVKAPYKHGRYTCTKDQVGNPVLRAQVRFKINVDDYQGPTLMATVNCFGFKYVHDFFFKEYCVQIVDELKDEFKGDAWPAFGACESNLMLMMHDKVHFYRTTVRLRDLLCVIKVPFHTAAKIVALMEVAHPFADQFRWQRSASNA